MDQSTFELDIRGKKVRLDDDGRVSLNDMWSAAGFSKNRTPADWTALETTSRLIMATVKRITGNSGILTKDQIFSVLYAKRGRGFGTWAHPVVALAYAEYLSPELAVEVREIFLRYKAADATLADEVLQKATPEANEWVARRAMGRAIRHDYTNELDKRGVSVGWQYGNCTNETYTGLFDKTANQLKTTKGLPKSGNLRDKMSMKELAFVAASEALSVERMDCVDAEGYGECRHSTAKAAKAIRTAIESDRKDRQSKLV